MRVLTSYVAALLMLAPPLLADGSGRISARGSLAPSEGAVIQQSYDLVTQGDLLLKSGDYASAEQEFKAASVLTWNPAADRGLAEALAAQGQVQEAIQEYRAVVYPRPDQRSTVENEMRTLMRYAILLSQAGQWQEAVTVYEHAFARPSFGDAQKLDAHFDPQIPMPSQLQALAHIAIGCELSDYDHNTAFSEFDKALRLKPDSPLTNYYYGYGWRHLDLKGRARAIYAPQAKAAFQKAANLGEGDVKKNAEEALKAFAPPK